MERGGGNLYISLHFKNNGMNATDRDQYDNQTLSEYQKLS